MNTTHYETVFDPQEHPLRGTAARIGVAALNLLQPGLGLIRLGRTGVGLLLAVSGSLPSLLMISALQRDATLTFNSFLVGAGIAIVALLLAYTIAIVMTWQAGKLLLPRHGYAWRWYGLAIIVLVIAAANQLIGGDPRAYYHPFVVPAESMEPTLKVGDRFYARMQNYGELRRGDVVMVLKDDVYFVKRIAAIPGDRIAMKDGIVILNGVAVGQRSEGSYRLNASNYAGVQEAKRYAERFPGEAVEHYVLDMNVTPQDNTNEYALLPGQYFVLGDNRDNAMDSRFPDMPDGGLGSVRREAIVGKAVFGYWRSGEGLREIKFH